MIPQFELFDSHLHIIDQRFPLQSNDGYLPAAFSCEDYLDRLSKYDLAGGAVVSGSFQAFDQGYLLAALEALGPGFVGVTQLPATVSDEEILELDAKGVRAVRFNVQRGGSESLDHLSSMAWRVYDLARWHVELYLDSRALGPLFETVVNLPAVSIDHLGLRTEGLQTLYAAAEQGVKIKATGFGRVDFDVEPVLRDLYSANPESLMFGTDLPSTRAPIPFQDGDLERVINALGEDAAGQVCCANAKAFYRP